MPHYSYSPYRFSSPCELNPEWVNMCIPKSSSSWLLYSLLIYLLNSKARLYTNPWILQRTPNWHGTNKQVQSWMKSFTTGQPTEDGQCHNSNSHSQSLRQSVPALVSSVLVVLMTMWSTIPLIPSTLNKIIGSRTIKQSQRQIIVVHIQGRTTTTTTTPLSTCFRWPGQQVMYPFVQQDTIANLTIHPSSLPFRCCWTCSLRWF